MRLVHVTRSVPVHIQYIIITWGTVSKVALQTDQYLCALYIYMEESRALYYNDLACRGSLEQCFFNNVQTTKASNCTKAASKPNGVSPMQWHALATTGTPRVTVMQGRPIMWVSKRLRCGFGQAHTIYMNRTTWMILKSVIVLNNNSSFLQSKQMQTLSSPMHYIISCNFTPSKCKR